MSSRVCVLCFRHFSNSPHSPRLSLARDPNAWDELGRNRNRMRLFSQAPHHRTPPSSSSSSDHHLHFTSRSRTHFQNGFSGFCPSWCIPGVGGSFLKPRNTHTHTYTLTDDINVAVNMMTFFYRLSRTTSLCVICCDHHDHQVEEFTSYHRFKT